MKNFRSLTLSLVSLSDVGLVGLGCGNSTPPAPADMAILSANPLNMESNPDQLSTVQVLGTVHQGKYFKNSKAGQAPIWPD